jgi:hypothetical protein
MKYFKLISFVTVFLSACSGDIDKNIDTDLQIEGKEIFRVNFSLEESLIYLWLSWNDFLTKKSEDFPGCPALSINEADKIITLTFDEKAVCANKRIPRKGIIILQFQDITTSERRILLIYENYTFNKAKLSGQRIFQQILNPLSINKRTETFTDLLITDEFGSTTKIQGTFEHQINLITNSLTTQGSLEGRGISGRKLKMSTTNPIGHEITCLQTGFSLGNLGSQKWEMYRNPTEYVTHTLVYEKEEGCQSKATLQLVDGRFLIFRL